MAKMERDASGKLLPGSGGRPAGARNKLQAAFIETMAEDFEAHGKGVIDIVRIEKPDVYLKVIASVLPKEWLIGESTFGDMSDEDIDDAINKIRALKPKAA